jgi:SOS-response transcriptional repressor LexA
MLASENATLKNKAPHLETFAPCAVKVAKFVEMPDDSMSPEIQPGDHLLFDPTEAPRAGDVVLVRLPSNEHFVRAFRPRTAYVFEAVAHNANYQPLTSTDDGALVVAVMVEHRRYRRAP